MNQQCEFCKIKFQLAKLRDFMGMSNYPIQSQARYCPYCGLDDNGQPAKQKAAKKEKGIEQ